VVEYGEGLLEGLVAAVDEEVMQRRKGGKPSVSSCLSFDEATVQRQEATR